MDDSARRALLGERAAQLAADGMVLGLGSGTTAEAFVRALGVRVGAGLAVSGVPTSVRTERVAREVGIPLTTLGDAERIDLGIDGADEIDPDLNLVKGRGGALLYEKLVAESCDRWVIVASSDKLVDKLGTRIPLPVEVIPYGWDRTGERLRLLGLHPRVRTDQDGVPFLTDAGHYILDCETGVIQDPGSLSAALKSMTGVVDHGLFIGLAKEALVCEPDGAIRSIFRN